MRLLHFFYLGLVCVVLTWSACDDEQMEECSFDIPLLPITGSTSCTPAVLTLGNLAEDLGFQEPSLPLDCETSNDLGRQVELAAPGGDELELHIYSGIRGTINLQVFGATNCDESITPITKCLQVTAAAENIQLNGLGGFDNLYLRLEFEGPTGAAYDPEPEDFVGLATYVNSPRGGEVEYVGTSQGEIESLARACNGEDWQRVILTSCDPGADIDAWAAETGLPQSERYGGNGATIVALDVPPGMDPNTVSPALARRRLERNDDSFIVEEDHIIFAPGESFPGLLPSVDDFISQTEFGQAEPCLSFDVNEEFSTGDDPDSPVRVTNIDSGVELGGNWDAAWENHRNIAFDVPPFISSGSLGFDFFDGDSEPDDVLGHGTTTAGALIGNYVGGGSMTVIHHKIFGQDGEATYFGALVAIYNAAEVSNVINCSWGYVDNEVPRAMDCAVKYAVDQGAFVVASAGNNRANITFGETPQWPATFSELYEGRVFTVASYQLADFGTDPNFNEPVLSLDFTNFGAAFSNTVPVAAYLTTGTPRFMGTDITYLAGTSLSAPLVSSALATSLANSGDEGGFLARLRPTGRFDDSVFDNQFLPVCPEEQ
ncbi:MAG: S8/S53 family peptidase [Bacteroidota bacterium]